LLSGSAFAGACCPRAASVRLASLRDPRQLIKLLFPVKQSMIEVIML